MYPALIFAPFPDPSLDLRSIRGFSPRPFPCRCRCGASAPPPFHRRRSGGSSARQPMARPCPRSFLLTTNHSSLATISFRIRTYEKLARNPFSMRTSKTQDLKPFRMNTYKKTGEGGPHLSSFLCFSSPIFLNPPPSTLQSPTSNLHPPISNHQSPTSNLQPPISNLQSPTSNFQPPTSNFQVTPDPQSLLPSSGKRTARPPAQVQPRSSTPEAAVRASFRAPSAR